MESEDKKCSWPKGIAIKPNGEDELDPCIYEDIEIHTNCTVIVSRCEKCGAIDVSWVKNDGCESFDPRTNTPL